MPGPIPKGLPLGGRDQPVSLSSGAKRLGWPLSGGATGVSRGMCSGANGRRTRRSQGLVSAGAGAAGPRSAWPPVMRSLLPYPVADGSRRRAGARRHAPPRALGLQCRLPEGRSLGAAGPTNHRLHRRVQLGHAHLDRRSPSSCARTLLPPAAAPHEAGRRALALRARTFGHLSLTSEARRVGPMETHRQRAEREARAIQ